MANAIHQTGKGETLATVTALYYAVRKMDSAARATIARAIREATPRSSLQLPDAITEPMPEGTTLFVPTLRAFNRALFVDNDALKEALEKKGFDHARKLLRYTPQQVIEVLSPLPKGVGARAVQRMWMLTAFLNVDGMDRFTAPYLFDEAGIHSLQDLARKGRAALEGIIETLITKHKRPPALREQRHGERWALEARILARKRVSELTKAKASLFRVPFAPATAAATAAFYESSADDATVPAREAQLAARLARLHRFQEAVLRGHLGVVSGRWSAAVEGYQQARRHWHRLAEDLGAAPKVDDTNGMNLRTAIDATRRLLEVLPADDDRPLNAVPSELRSGRRDRTFRLRGFRYDELNPGRRVELQSRLASRQVHELPERFRSAVQRAVMGKMRDELERADPRLVGGLVPGAGTALMRDLEAQDRDVLRRNIGGAALHVLYGKGAGGKTTGARKAKDSQLAGADAPLDVFDAIGDQLAISEVQELVPGLWKDGQPTGAFLSDAAAARYPKGFLDRPDVTPFTKFVVLPGAAGKGERFIPLTANFAAEYEKELLAPRLTSADGADAAFDEGCWTNAGAFASIAPYLYSVEIPFGLRRAYSHLDRSDLASRYGGLRVSVYENSGAVATDLTSVEASDLIYDLDLYACSSHWVDPSTVEPEFAIYLLDIEEYARWYTDVADRAYRCDHRTTARSWYSDVMCAVEAFWGNNDLAVQAQNALTGVRNSIVAIGNGLVNENLHGLSTLNVQFEADGDVKKILEDRFLLVRRETPYPAPTGPSPRRGAAPSARSRGNGGASVDFEAVDIAVDRALVGDMTQVGSVYVLINYLGGSSELYALYLYCSSKIAALDAGLNWYGFPRYYVPPWSFQHLYGLARDLCNRSLDAERNTFALLQTLEAAQKEVVQASQTLEMANEALSLAEARVTQQEAANELAWTQAAIAFNQAGLAETQNEMHGTVDLLTGWAGFLFNPIASAGQFFSGAVNLSNGLQYEQLTSLSHEAWLQTEDLNEASLAVAIAERDVAALSQQQAADYLAFLDSQTLDVGAYDYLLALSREVTEHYLEHANRLAWLAQRALSHETRQTYDLIALTYTTGEELLDLTKAQRLTADLESMLATYTAGQTRRHQELKWTIALSQLSPGALQALRASGVAVIVLSQQMLDMFFPGHCLHSLKDIAMTVLGTLPPTGVRGVLQSSGVSWVRVPNDGSYEDGSNTLADWPTPDLADPGEASNPDFDGYDGYIMKMIRSVGSSVSLSQFDVQRDRAVLNLPQGMLSSVQHLGMDTAWTLELHRQANAFEFDEIQDVELTFWLQAAFDPALAQAQYEALVRRGKRGELQASSLTSFATNYPDQWAGFTGDAADREALDLRLLTVDVGELPPWEAARRLANVMVACARDAGAGDELTLRLSCAHDPVGYRFTTVDGVIFSAVGLKLRPRDPQPDPDFSAWVESALYGPRGNPFADPEVRWVIKAAPAQIGNAWLARDENGTSVTTSSGALRGTPKLTDRPTASFNDGSGWTDMLLRVRVAHRGGAVRLRVRDNGSEHYAAEISAKAVRLLQVEERTERALTTRPLAYPGDEFLLVELGVVDQMLMLRIDGITLFENVGGGSIASGTVGLEVIGDRTQPPFAPEFDDVEVVRLTKLWVEAETLLAEPFTQTLPADWTFTSAGTSWTIDPAGHHRLDLRSLQNVTLKLDYLHQMVESAS